MKNKYLNADQLANDVTDAVIRKIVQSNIDEDRPISYLEDTAILEQILASVASEFNVRLKNDKDHLITVLGELSYLMIKQAESGFIRRDMPFYRKSKE